MEGSRFFERLFAFLFAHNMPQLACDLRLSIVLEPFILLLFPLCYPTPSADNHSMSVLHTKYFWHIYMDSVEITQANNTAVENKVTEVQVDKGLPSCHR